MPSKACSIVWKFVSIVYKYFDKNFNFFPSLALLASALWYNDVEWCQTYLLWGETTIAEQLCQGLLPSNSKTLDTSIFVLLRLSNHFPMFTSLIFTIEDSSAISYSDSGHDLQCFRQLFARYLWNSLNVYRMSRCVFNWFITFYWVVYTDCWR